ncbi:MAG TPA: hypothetical protein VHC69_10710 [Polyangiaceae bacterium]|nr:hypothetical protein [Polyangiaceae bacterium]
MRVLAWAACALVVACGQDGPSPRGAPPRAAPAIPASSVVGSPAAAPKPPLDDCARKIAALLATPSLPGTPELEARRAETFARAKADPVLFVRAPVAKRLHGEAEDRRHAIFDASERVRAFYEAYPALQKRRDLARELLLTEGYLYAAWPPFAAALSNLVRPEDLFHEPVLYIQRGAETLRAKLKQDRSGASYTYLDGPEAGARVKLLLYDRVAPDPSALGPPLHRDVGRLRGELGFEEMKVRHLSEDRVVADLRYGDVFVPTVIRAEGAALSLECEAVPPASRAAVLAAREDNLRRTRLLDKLRAVIAQQVEEALPFDEPKTEVGQQDGKLRQHWVWAYRYGRNDFDFNDDKYKVFDARGRPRVPQVCIDFVTDTFERASGSWYRHRGEPRERVPGRLDFAALGIDNERSVESFVEFAKAHPDAFDVYELPDEERVPYARRAEFFAHLAAHRDRYRPGDIVTIYGLRDDDKMHYHSFFVYDADPVTGAPSLVAANAGRPRVRPWEAEMVSAPKRSIRARIRPKLPWLTAILAPPDASPAEPTKPPPSSI